MANKAPHFGTYEMHFWEQRRLLTRKEIRVLARAARTLPQPLLHQGDLVFLPNTRRLRKLVNRARSAG
jgi:hypothetical protein